MRIALDYTSEIGVRAGRLLMGEDHLELLGVLRRNVRDRDPKIRRIESIAGFDAVVTDDPSSTIVAEAAADGVPCVLWADPGPLSDDAARVILSASNLVEGIGRSLFVREVEEADDGTRSLFAWTEPGRVLRHGESVAFPSPVGARWGSRRRSTDERVEIAVPVPDEWAGVLVTTTRHGRTTTTGIADLATHLEGIALAAGAVIVADGTVPPGVHRPPAFAVPFLAAALRIGLDAASFVAEG